MSVKRMSAIIFIVFATLLISACGTTRNFVIDSNPKGALITSQLQSDNAYLTLVSARNYGETPTKAAIVFSSEDSKYSATAEKRGYAPATCMLDQNSKELVTFDLKRLEGISEKVFNRAMLPSGAYIFLPAFVEVMIHSGYGNWDKYEYAPDISKKIMDDLNSELAKPIASNTTRLRGLHLKEDLVKDWSALSPELNQYLQKLDPKKLSYSSLPPYINANVQGYKSVIKKDRNLSGGSEPYLLYIKAKCISETTGRKVGNVIGTILATGRGYSTAPFDSNSSTLVVMYVIDAKTSEVLYIDQIVFPDITDPDAFKSMVTAILTFPDLVLKKQ